MTPDLLAAAVRDLVERGDLDPDDLLGAVRRAAAEAFAIELPDDDENDDHDDTEDEES